MLRRAVLIAAAVFLICGFRPAWAADLPSAWMQFSSAGVPELRALVPEGVACPSVTADGAALSVRIRTDGTQAFPIRVCAAQPPSGARSMEVGGLPAPQLPAAINRIILFGDTGCRLKGPDFIQDCNI